MDRVRRLGFVDEANHGLGIPLHHEGRAWRHAVVTDERGVAPVGIHVGRELLDLDLVVSYVLAVDGVLDGSGHVSRCPSARKYAEDLLLDILGLGNGQGILVEPLVRRAQPVLGRGLANDGESQGELGEGVDHCACFSDTSWGEGGSLGSWTLELVLLTERSKEAGSG